MAEERAPIQLECVLSTYKEGEDRAKYRTPSMPPLDALRLLQQHSCQELVIHLISSLGSSLQAKTEWELIDEMGKLMPPKHSLPILLEYMFADAMMDAVQYLEMNFQST